MSSAGQVQPLFLAPQPPQQQKQGNQGQREKEGAAMVVNGAVDHLGPDMYAKQSDDQDPEPVPQDPERNHEGHQYDPSPPGSQKEMGRKQAGDEQHPTGVDPAALLGHLEHDPGQLEHRAVRAPVGSPPR